MAAKPQETAALRAWPDYLQPIQERATKRWDQLEADLEQPEYEQKTEGPNRELIETDIAPRPCAMSRPPRPGIMARFALGQGYKADGEDRFFHADGSWIGRANGARFPWERLSAGGEILRHYYPKDHCLEHEPLQLEADVWGLLDQKPDIYSFILINPKGEDDEHPPTRSARGRRANYSPRNVQACL